MHIGTYIELVYKGQKDLVEAFGLVADKHGDEPDIQETCKLCESWSAKLVEKMEPFTAKYPAEKDDEPDRLLSEFFKKKRTGALALIRDLHGTWLLANEGEVSAILLRQAAAGLHDKELIAVCDEIEKTSKRQISWLLTRMKSSAPQAMIAAK